MRHKFLGSDFCKAKAKELTGPGKVYEGLAVLSAFQIRSTGCDVVDSRHVYLGHADIKIGIDVPAGEPPPAEQLVVIQDRRKDLAKSGVNYEFLQILHPSAAKCTGHPLVPKSGSGL